MEGQPEQRQEWRFRIGDAFPADNPLARFIVAVAQAMNDNEFANSHFVNAQEDYERIYFFNLASSHLYEAAETFRRAHREWREVRDFVSSLDADHQQDFERIVALADPGAAWPGNRLKELRNTFFHYLRLDRAAVDAGQLPLLAGLRGAADLDSSVTIDPDGVLTGIRAVFADEVHLNTLTADYDDGELERLVASFATYQPALQHFAQAAVGRYLAELPRGVVRVVGG